MEQIVLLISVRNIKKKIYMQFCTFTNLKQYPIGPEKGEKNILRQKYKTQISHSKMVL